MTDLLSTQTAPTANILLSNSTLEFANHPRRRVLREKHDASIEISRSLGGSRARPDRFRTANQQAALLACRQLRNGHNSLPERFKRSDDRRRGAVSAAPAGRHSQLRPAGLPALR